MLPRSLLLLTVALMALHLLHYWAGWSDDAYITFRYSRNLIAGEGFVYNPGEHVEGITNLLWGLLLGPLSLLGDLLLTTKILGFMCALGTVLLVGAWARPLSLPAQAVALLPLALVPWIPGNALSGLETPAAMFVITLAWTRLGRDQTVPWSAIGATLAPLIRPDGAIISAFFLLSRLPHRNNPVDRRGLGLLVGAGALTVVAKLLYFGALLPNTFHVKKATFPYGPGWFYIYHFLFAHSLLFGALALVGLGVALWQRRVVAAIFLIGGLILSVWTGGDFFPNYRFLAPTLPALFGALALVVDRQSVWAQRALAALVLGSCIIQTPIATAKSTTKNDFPHFTYEVKAKQAPLWAPWADKRWGWTWPAGGREIPTAIMLVFLPDGATAAYTDIGVPGYVSDNPLVDLYGLTDRTVARRDLNPKEKASYVLDRADMILVRKGARATIHKAMVQQINAGAPHQQVLGLKAYEIYARPEGWGRLPSATLLSRVQTMLQRMPRSLSLHRAVLDFLVITGGADDAIAAIRAHVAARGTPQDVRYLEGGLCFDPTMAAGVRCPAKCLPWTGGDPDAFSFVAPAGSDSAHLAAVQERIELACRPEAKGD